MNGSPKTKRSIRDISHHFLSSASVSDSYPHTPVAGCYLTKSIRPEERIVREWIQRSHGPDQSVQVSYVSSSPLALKSHAPFTVTPMPEDVLHRTLTLARRKEIYPFASKPKSDAYYFVFQEEDCGMLDDLIPSLNPLAILCEASTKDITEVYKLIKGYAALLTEPTWFLYFYPEPSAEKTKRLTNVFNDALTAAFNFQAHSWYGEETGLLSAWKAALDTPDTLRLTTQLALAKCIDEQSFTHESISQTHIA